MEFTAKAIAEFLNGEVIGDPETKVNNIAKIEDYIIDNKKQKVIVHRKGATRAFGPGFKELPKAYQNVGQPVIIPGSMGTCSYVLAGSHKSKELTFGSCSHGAGRRLSRRAAKLQVNAPVLKEKLKEQGIHSLNDKE